LFSAEQRAAKKQRRVKRIMSVDESKNKQGTKHKNKMSFAPETGNARCVWWWWWGGVMAGVSEHQAEAGCCFRIRMLAASKL
jgi:hypothetical protein